MQPQTVCEIINHDISYKPGWTFDAVPYPRYDGTVRVRISYEVNNSNTEYAPDYSSPVTPTPMMDIFIFCPDITTANGLYSKILDAILQIETHEAREFFKVDGSLYRAPFHPHTVDGIFNWEGRRKTFTTKDLTGEPLMLFEDVKSYGA